MCKFDVAVLTDTRQSETIARLTISRQISRLIAYTLVEREYNSADEPVSSMSMNAVQQAYRR